MKDNEFRCPVCLNYFNVDDGIIKKVKTKSEVISNYRYKDFDGNLHVRSLVQNSFTKIRYCQDCQKRRKRKDNISLCVYFMFILATFIIVYLVYGSFQGAFITTLLGTFIYTLILGWYCMRLDNEFIHDINMGMAIEENAIVPFDEEELKNEKQKSEEAEAKYYRNKLIDGQKRVSWWKENDI